MLESVKTIANPLTIIGLFAALSEVAMVVALKSVDPDQQYVFIWFVMGFPALLVVLFFITLNFNHEVLYAPSDYRDDATFIAMSGIQRISSKLEQAEGNLLTAPDRILSEFEGKIKFEQPGQREQFEEYLKSALSGARNSIVEAKSDVDRVAQQPPQTFLEYADALTVGKVLREGPADLETLAASTRLIRERLIRALTIMVVQEHVAESAKNGKLVYELTAKGWNAGS